MKTVMASALRILADSLKEILVEANLECTKNGVFIKAMDNTKSQMIKLQLYADKMDEFRCASDEPLFLGIDMQNFNKIIRSINNDDVFIMYYNENEKNNLKIELHNKKTEMIKNYSLKLIDIDHNEVPEPNLSDDIYTIVSMPSLRFKNICKEQFSLSSMMEIIYTKNLLEFKCEGTSSNAKYDINIKSKNLLEYDPDTDFRRDGNLTENTFVINVPDGKEHEIIQGVYSLKNLCQFTKCTNLCVALKLYMANGKALVVNYTNADLGEIFLFLAPYGTQ